MEKPQENTSPDYSNLNDEKQSPRDLVLDKSWSPSPVATLAMGCDTNESVRYSTCDLRKSLYWVDIILTWMELSTLVIIVLLLAESIESVAYVVLLAM